MLEVLVHGLCGSEKPAATEKRRVGADKIEVPRHILAGGKRDVPVASPREGVEVHGSWLIESFEQHVPASGYGRPRGHVLLFWAVGHVAPALAVPGAGPVDYVAFAERRPKPTGDRESRGPKPLPVVMRGITCIAPAVHVDHAHAQMAHPCHSHWVSPRVNGAFLPAKPVVGEQDVPPKNQDAPTSCHRSKAPGRSPQNHPRSSTFPPSATHPGLPTDDYRFVPPSFR